MSVDDPSSTDATSCIPLPPAESGASPAAAQSEFAGGGCFWPSIWMGTTLAGSLFGAILAQDALGLMAGAVLAGVVALPVHLTYSIVTWSLSLSRLRIVLAALAGGTTGAIATGFVYDADALMFGGLSFAAAQVIAASLGALGGGVAGALHRAWLTRQGREAEGTRGRRVTLHGLAVRLMVLAAVAAVWVGIIAFISRAHQHAVQASCANHLKMIGIALKNHAIAKRSYPPTRTCDTRGRAIQSWRAHLMPYLGVYSFLDEYALAEPWDSPKNRGYNDRRGGIFVCPSEPRKDTRFTNYVAVVGPETMWQGTQATRPDEVVNQDAILVVEYPESNIPWREPRDVAVEEFLAMLEARWAKGDFGPHPDGLLYVTVAGDVGAIGCNANLESVRERLRARRTLGATGVSPVDAGTRPLRPR